MFHLFLTMFYLPLVVILGLILVIGLGGHLTWHRIPFFDGYAHYLFTCSQELYEIVAGEYKMPLWLKTIRVILGITTRLVFTTIFFLLMPLFMGISIIFRLFKKG